MHRRENKTAFGAFQRPYLMETRLDRRSDSTASHAPTPDAPEIVSDGNARRQTGRHLAKNVLKI